MENRSEILRDKTRIILVDDDDLFRESLQQNLSDAGFDAMGFGNGGAAVAGADAHEGVR